MTIVRPFMSRYHGDGRSDRCACAYQLLPNIGPGPQLVLRFEYFIFIAAVQPSVTGTIGAGHREDISGEYQHRQYCGGSGEEDDDGGDAGHNGYNDDAEDRYRHPNQPQADYASSPYAGGATTSEPGDFYDYGWDYEMTTAAGGSGQQTPQTPSYQQQQQQQQQRQLDRRRRRRGGRPVRL